MESGPTTTGIKRGMLGILLLGIVIPVGGMVFVRLFFPLQKWLNVPLHSVIEIMGSFAAISLAVLLLLLRNHDREQSHHVWVASGLIAMGTLEGFHATVFPYGSFIWLRCAANLTGGFLFSLVWLPERVARSRTANILPFITSLAIALFAILSVFVRDSKSLLENVAAGFPMETPILMD